MSIKFARLAYIVKALLPPALCNLNCDKVFPLLSDRYTIPKRDSNPPKQSKDCHQSTPLPPSHHGWVLLYLITMKLFLMLWLSRQRLLSHLTSFPKQCLRSKLAGEKYFQNETAQWVSRRLLRWNAQKRKTISTTPLQCAIITFIKMLNLQLKTI